ncbi:hypothetical protein TRIATDRAFT_87176 [Trichoderma atroviride IMI 206040]|uniref:Uncharacterized protein n=1 Tax=Hypocrea atroviridis (strain ATCC 20476 / IMI 206040) TaxID=452589 RepID=G9P061_HYPAI|nr:uncharacterized protein TRIATDRAFT_87176 [Trichoderma atroviride IMI 206040]EHK44107.1 hypothetical protein TRIATDRAFT_87176 [Trichoderma atroviride IMI 206040]
MVADKVLRRPGDGTTLVEAMDHGSRFSGAAQIPIPRRLTSAPVIGLVLRISQNKASVGHALRLRYRHYQPVAEPMTAQERSHQRGSVSQPGVGTSSEPLAQATHCRHTAEPRSAAGRHGVESFRLAPPKAQAFDSERTCPQSCGVGKSHPRAIVRVTSIMSIISGHALKPDVKATDTLTATVPGRSSCVPW